MTWLDVFLTAIAVLAVWTVLAFVVSWLAGGTIAYRNAREATTRLLADCDDALAQLRAGYRAGQREVAVLTDLPPALVALLAAEVYAEVAAEREAESLDEEWAAWAGRWGA